MPQCEDVALTTLRSQARDAGLVVETESEPSEEIEQGRVIRCDPESGALVDDGSTLVVFVSSGAESVAVPRLRGQTLEQAQTTLAGVDLSVGEIDREPDPTVPEGSVITTDPAEGVDVEPGSQVDLVHQHRTDADADADAHPGADPDPDAGADAGADAAATERGADPDPGSLARSPPPATSAARCYDDRLDT